MGVDFTSRERIALDRLLAENATDIILKTDRRGYILHASPSMERWGLPLPGTLIGSHLLHLAHPSGSATIKGCTPAQLALAWVLAQGEDMVPIPGTKRRKYLEDNLGALDVDLSGSDLVRLNEILPPGAAVGTRYTAAQMASLGR